MTRVLNTTLLLIMAASGGVMAAQIAPTPAVTTAPQPPPPPPPPPPPAPAKYAPPQDWPNLARYRAEDAATPPPTPGEPRVIFMGDSITEIWGKSPDRGTFFPGKPYLNRGISGQTTPQMLLRFQQDVIHLHPAVVVINAGTNDIAGNTGPETVAQIEDNLSSMATLARANGIRVVLATITPADHYNWRPGIQPVQAIHAVNAWIRVYCAQTGAVYLDYFDAMAEPTGAMRPGLSNDGVHPLTAGFSIMGPLASAAITKALAH